MMIYLLMHSADECCCDRAGVTTGDCAGVTIKWKLLRRLLLLLPQLSC